MPKDRFWYYCSDCKTEWTAEYDGKLNGCTCSYCGSLNTKFIGWED